MNDDLGRRLRELAGMYASGSLTDAEFAAAKARVLGTDPAGAAPDPGAGPPPGPPPPTPRPTPPASTPSGPAQAPAPRRFASSMVQIGSWDVPTPVLAGAVAILLIATTLVVVGVASSVATDFRSMAIGRWTCTDGPDDQSPHEIVVGDGTYVIVTDDNRSGSWSLDGTRLVITETSMDSYGALVRGSATVDLTTLDGPGSGAVSFEVTYGSGSEDSAGGAAQYEPGSATIRLQHDSSLNQGADDLTCSKE